MQIGPVAPGHRDRLEELRGLEAGSVDEHVGLDQFARDGADPVRLDPRDAVGDEPDVLALEGLGPGAVVADAALGPQRILRRDLLEQIGAVGEGLPEVLGEHLAGEVVDRADGVRTVREIVLDANRLERAVTHPPEDREPVELAVPGHMSVEPLQTGRNGLVVLGSGRQPTGRALIDRERPTFRSDDREELQGARARADARHTLGAELDGVVPHRRMKPLPGERVAALDIRELRPAQLSDGTDHGIGTLRLGGAVRVAHEHVPGRVGLEPCRRDDLRTQHDVLIDAERLGAVLEVLPEDVRGREVERPVVPLGEGVAVVVVRVVDAAAGIGVDEPCTREVVVLLDDLVGDTGLGEAVGGEDAGHAGADDQHVHAATRRHLGERPVRGAAVLAAVGHLLFEQRQIRVHRRATDGELEDLDQLVVGRRGSRVATAVSVRRDRRERERPDLRLLRVGQPALRHRREQRVGAEVLAEQAEVSGEVGQGRQQRRELSFGQRCADLGVGGRDGRDARDERARRGGCVGRHHDSCTPFGARWPMNPNR